MREIQDGNNTLTYVLPDVIDPSETVCVTLHIPKNKFHLMAFKGAIWDLCNWWNWERDDAHTATQVAQVWRRVFRSMEFTDCNQQPLSFADLDMESEEMAQLTQEVCDDQGNCLFQYRCDVCGSWHTAATTDQVNAPHSPSAGSPQPGPDGGSITVCSKLFANNTLLLSAPVSSGDTVTIISADGSGNDGGEVQWRCPDGGTYFGGLCDDPAVSFPGGDPVNSAPHMSLLLLVSGVYYPFYPGPFPYTLVPITIPGGITAANAEFIVNDSAIGNNKGDYNICYKQVNNQPGSWTRTLDFRLSDQGFVYVPIGGVDYGSWIGGSGWQSTPYPPGGAGATVLAIHKLFSASTFLSANITCNQTPAATGSGAGNSVILKHAGTNVAIVDLGSVFSGTQTDSWSGSQTVDEILISPSSGNSALFTEITMVLTGNGTPPF